MTAEPVAWLNGRFLPLSQASLSIFDAGVTTGATVTERLRTFRHEPFLLDEHLARLAASADAAFVPLSMPVPAIDELVRDVVRRNAAAMPADDDLAVSVFATAGSDAGPTLCVHATPIPARLYATHYESGVRLAIPPTCALPMDTVSPQIKSRSRLHWHIADVEAASISRGAKALLVDRDGFVTETAIGNVFVVSADGERIATPRRTRTLHGISQAFVLGSLPQATEADLRVEDLQAAGEVLLTSSVSCVLPVVQLNQTSIADGRPGRLYRQVLAAWSERVGVDIARQMRRMAGEQWN